MLAKLLSNFRPSQKTLYYFVDGYYNVETARLKPTHGLHAFHIIAIYKREGIRCSHHYLRFLNGNS